MSISKKCLIGKILIALIFACFLQGAAYSSEQDSLSDVLTTYRKCLPCICHEYDNIPKAIVSFLKEFQPAEKTKGDKMLEEKEKEKEKVQTLMLEKKVQTLMQEDQSLKFVLPSFPFKSLNPGKVISPGEPDLAEAMGLITLDHLCSEIKKVYEPGAKVIIVPDAIRIAEFLGVTDERDEYIRKIRILAPDNVVIKELHEMKDTPRKEDMAKTLVDSADSKLDVKSGGYISFVGREINCAFYTDKLRELRFPAAKVKALAYLKGTKAYKNCSVKLREKLKDCLDYDATLDLLKVNVKVKNEYKSSSTKFIGILHSKFTEKQILKKYRNAGARVAAEEAAQFSKYLARQFGEYKEYIRLSVNHHHPDISKKLPIKLVQCSTQKSPTPWHTSLFIDEDGKIDFTREQIGKGVLVRKVNFNGMSLAYRCASSD